MEERNCAIKLYATHFRSDLTIQDIRLWVSLAYPLDTSDNTTRVCPKWQVNLNNSDTLNVSCGTPAPYVCVNGKKST